MKVIKLKKSCIYNWAYLLVVLCFFNMSLAKSDDQKSLHDIINQGGKGQFDCYYKSKKTSKQCLVEVKKELVEHPDFVTWNGQSATVDVINITWPDGDQSKYTWSDSGEMLNLNSKSAWGYKVSGDEVEIDWSHGFVILKGDSEYIRLVETNHNSFSNQGNGNYVELGEFIKLFMLDSSESEDVPDWHIGAGSTDLPITWLTNGIESKKITPSDEKPYDLYFRHAEAMIKVYGTIMKTLQKKSIPLKWSVNLESNWDKLPKWVTFIPDQDCLGAMGSGCNYELEKALKISNINHELKCQFNMDVGAYQKIYKINFKNKKPAYLIEDYNEGSGGATVDVSLIYPSYLKDKVSESFSSIKNYRCGNKVNKDCLRESIIKSSEECRI